MRTTLIAAALLGLVLGAGGAPPPTGQAYDGYLPETEYTVVTVLVTDGVTGEPIEGAVLNRHPENYPTAAGWAPFEDVAVTDRFGLASIEVGEQTYPCHWVVHAKGYAPTEEYGQAEDFEIELFPGRDLRGRIEDVFGRPAAGITVEYKTGCAHAPALRTATTDEEGVFTIPEVEERGDLHWGGPGIRCRYGNTDDLLPSPAPPPVLLALPGTTLTGRITGADPFDLLGATIWSRTSARGPLAGIASDGSFALEGADPEARLLVMNAGESVPEEIDPADHAPGRPILVRIGAGEERERVAVTVAVRTEEGGPAPAGVAVHLDRRSDGRRTTVRTEGAGAPAAFEVPAGSYDLSAGGPWDRFVADPREIEIGADPAAPALTVREQSRLDVTIPPAPADPDQPVWAEPRAILTLCLPGRTRRIWNRPLSEPVALGDIWLPPEAPARLHLERMGSSLRPGAERAFVVEPARDGRRHVSFAWPDPPPALAPEPEPDPGQALRLHLPEGLDADWLCATVFPPDPDPAGAALLGADEDGVIRDAHLVPGATVVLGVLPGPASRIVLEGPGPWEWRPGTATLEIRVAGGEDLFPELWLDGEMVRNAAGGAWRIPYLPAGPHRLIVGADGREARTMRVVLEEQETRAVDIRLEKRAR